MEKQSVKSVNIFMMMSVHLFSMGSNLDWNMENLKGNLLDNEKSFWYRIFNLLPKEEYSDWPSDEILPYKLPCMGSTVSIYCSEAVNWMLSFTKWIWLPCATAVHLRLELNSLMCCLNYDPLLLMIWSVIKNWNKNIFSVSVLAPAIMSSF